MNIDLKMSQLPYPMAGIPCENQIGQHQPPP